VKFIRHLVFLACFWVIGCNHKTNVVTKEMMIGQWVPDTAQSVGPKGWILAETKLELKEDGTFLAQHFPKEVSLGAQSLVKGHWSLEPKDNKWRLNLPWETPTASILDAAIIITKGTNHFIEIWTDPDSNQRLQLRKK
jgi:hypothetical protein